ncbi:acyl-CoA carboxylase epsilon subunit [Dermatophilus congolensis]|uniref:Acyl-CoA carboxylase subunit epsilon n=1 Tax=Dermatophilus congolensis TaxID=1863 RepID=A0A239VDW2_9MICO|nr:acyl-CoA carboxylase epsilon subunit [Dermatophilus congolensis]MBO3128547.1 acyl-CoA carboxylase subunit epsilon [Dermatophilus congolensis]MBO3132816.1 acyl-CoA carboxylase subunit epsilon [Dermatophilus congolensis]MBO3133025.1 acyl-CoA carboxylase subunit epsilon [Dermatophilus congolensis]MBO3135258.1 acyl-CoA carboxylase subunit epsilon [Dermatophilus congolensis]MBO3137499.1 acyl-CoA carboxylase subunit epsilon [Dermatophilus congolensis]
MAMSAGGGDAGEPWLRVVRGNPSQEELAALLVVVLALSRNECSSAQELGQRSSGWANRRRMLSGWAGRSGWGGISS